VDGFLGAKVENTRNVFSVVRTRGQRRLDSLGDRQGSAEGWQVVSGATVIDDAGYGNIFFHSTGHSIGETSRNGVNMDAGNKDTRRLIAARALLLSRNLLARVWHPQRSQRLYRERDSSARH